MVSDPRPRWQRDPRAFASEALNATLWAKQVEILEALRDHPRVAVASCHESGKTFVASVAAAQALISRPNTIVVSTAPGGRQVQSLLGAEIGSRFASFRAKFGEDAVPPPNATSWFMDRERFPKWYWQGFSTSADTAQEHATRFVGFHPAADGQLVLIFDEAGGVTRPIWQAADGLMTSSRAKWLAIGNPTDATSEFAACWRSPDWYCLSISAFDCPNLQPGAAELDWGVTRKWVDGMIRKYGEGALPVETKGDGRFHTGVGDTLISAGALMPAPKRLETVCVHDLVWVGVDVAQFGDDSTFVVAVCHGCDSILAVEERNGQELTATAGMTQATARALGLNEDHARQVAVDDTGLGGVCSMLRENGWNVQAIQFGAAPSRSRNDERVKDRRTELWWTLREWIPRANLAGLDPRWHDELFGDLTLIKYAYRSDSVIQLEAKKDLKKRTGHSPDFGDALALAISAIKRRDRCEQEAPRPSLTADDEEDARDDDKAARRLASKWGPLSDRLAGFGQAGGGGEGWTRVE